MGLGYFLRIAGPIGSERFKTYRPNWVWKVKGLHFKIGLGGSGLAGPIEISRLNWLWEVHNFQAQLGLE